MRRLTYINVFMVLVTGAVAGLLSSCTHGEASAASNVALAATVETVPDINVISVENPERFSVAPAVARREADQLTATGVVAADVSRTVPVSALSSGRVTEIRSRLGDDVQKDQLLLRMTSPDMSQAISDYQKFRADEALAKTQLDRVRLLYSRTSVRTLESVACAESTSLNTWVSVASRSLSLRRMSASVRAFSP